MVKRMLIDATQHEETRVAIVEDNRLEEFDYESAMRKPLKGNIFLAKVTRVEPSLQAAFVNYGGNRHGFLPFSEIHPDYFRIPVADQEEFERMQREQLEEHDKMEANEEEDLEDNSEASDDSEDESASSEDDQDDAQDVDAADDNENEEDSNDDEDNGDDSDASSDDEAESSDDTDAEASESDDESEGDADDNKKRGRGRGGRGRGRGRGRGGRGGRSFRNKRPENFGDDEAGQAQRFRFNLRRKYKIQEVIKRGQIMLIQVSREERGNKGAAVSTYLSLPGRYCVLMPNSPRGGGVSRKISNHQDRSKMKDLLSALKVPAGMSAIVRTAGVTRTKTEVKRDLDYLMRLWNSIRELTLQSTAPSLVYEEADLIKRSVRDHYTRDIEEILVAGAEGHKNAKEFMKMLMPSHAKRVKLYEDTDISLLQRYQVETQIAEIGETEVTLPSGGYLVINPTEALVSVDVNSGRSTKERNIEGTALKTNLEAAEEVARQLRLRDLGGLVVIDFIDMEDRRNNGKVERKMRDALANDKARVQVGRISSFGLMELSRQRLNASLSEAQFEVCPHCEGRGRVRTADSASLLVIRAIEAEGVRKRAAEVIAHVPANVALYILNYKRSILSDLEERYGLQVLIRVDESLSASSFRVEVSKPLNQNNDDAEDDSSDNAAAQDNDQNDQGKKGRNRRGKRGGRNRNKDRNNDQNSENQNAEDSNEGSEDQTAEAEPSSDTSEDKPKRKRGRKPKKKTEESAEADSDSKASDDDAQSPKDDTSSEDSPAPKEKKKPAKRTRAKKIEITEESTDVQPEKADEASASEDKPSKAKAKDDKPAAASNDDAPSEASEHETVNQAPKKKKRGWWSKK